MVSRLRTTDAKLCGHGIKQIAMETCRLLFLTITIFPIFSNTFLATVCAFAPPPCDAFPPPPCDRRSGRRPQLFVFPFLSVSQAERVLNQINKLITWTNMYRAVSGSVHRFQSLYGSNRCENEAEIFRHAPLRYTT